MVVVADRNRNVAAVSISTCRTNSNNRKLYVGWMINGRNLIKNKCVFASSRAMDDTNGVNEWSTGALDQRE